MRKPQGCSGPLLLVAACAALAAGCKEEFSDEPFGVLDLAPVYDGGTRTNPTLGLPTQINPQIGFVDGKQIEYYDFGVVSTTNDDLTGQPVAVAVQPMYFFFTPQGFPLFSPPVRESRDGTDWMRGGQGVLDPNPRDFCAGVPADRQGQDPCVRRNAEEKARPYPLRARELFVDPNRHTANFQRPIVDFTPADQGYTGFWEIVEITVPPDYDPDAIKHAATLRDAIGSGKFRRRDTRRVINCPLVDERTAIAPGVTDRATPHPKIELWYRRRLAFCFLGNGWETLGNTQGQLLFSNSDDQRVDTFDVGRLSIGEGKQQETRLVLPIARAYVPVIFTSDQGNSDPNITRIVDNLLARGLPRHRPTDPDGYTPLRWMWDLVVEFDYRSGALTSVDAIDPVNTLPQGAFAATFVPIVHNIAMRGTAVPCSYPPVAGRNPPVCGRVVPTDDPATPLIDGRGDVACTPSGLECNKDSCYCDAPFVGYGQACGAGLAQCNPEKDALSDTGYGCFPASGGFCYLACDPAQRNTRAADNRGLKATELRDSRCKDLPGFLCLSYNRGGLCLKLCDQNVVDPNQCSAPTMVDTAVRDLGDSQVCQDLGIEVCAWPDTYTPS
jgi:hypothetical protein